MTDLPPDRVFARYERRAGAVLVVGTGAVGGFLAEELARAGCDPLWLLDPDVLEVENLIRHPLGAPDLGRPKAPALAERIRRDFPLCHAAGIHANFLRLGRAEQLRLVEQADVVVAATDSPRCQQRVNEVAVAAGTPAVYPAVWVDPRVRDAEVGEILWVAPDRRGPCYACAFPFRNATPAMRAVRGARLDIQLTVLCAAQIVTALLAHDTALLDPGRTALYVHGLGPPSRGIRDLFPAAGLASRSVRVRLPATPCRVCGGWQNAGSGGPLVTRWQAYRDAVGIVAVVALFVVLLVLSVRW
ncbi:HesA/MoeB/ThiF family protein [Amycolatopsis benzoatilytica]|uniref:HesA/MoeB/ThiF family protein n=1 Tax=Amycolatopsis benzoatilytica TaxID=346045 RepID=UPI000381341B|nr:ThiF family adenylyltransferase [Amycolatopsis benzoatilytica]